MSRFRHTEGSRLPALERNILKYRAFEMMLALYYAEELKRFLVSTVEATDRWQSKLEKRSPRSKKVNHSIAADFLFKEGCLSPEERAELKQLVDFRNQIAHELHMLTFDLGRSTFVRQMLRLEKPRYDYKLLDRLKFYRDELPDRLPSRFMFVMSFDSLFFEAAEQTYKLELRTLRKKINKQIAARKAKMGQLTKELSLDGLPADLWPYHPANVRRNGTLNMRGIEVCYRLFDAGKNSLAVGYLMHISKRAANGHYKGWCKAGGTNRSRVELPALRPMR